MSYSVSLLAESVGIEYFDAVAGGETAGIPFAAFLSERLALPMQYVRKKKKDLEGMRKLKVTLNPAQKFYW